MAKKYKTPSIEQLLDCGVHFGHQVRRWNPRMAPYIFAQRMGIHVIDLEQTEQLLKDACDFLYEVASKGGQIIFVGTKRQATDIISLEAKRSGALFVNDRWVGGTITNFPIIKKNIDKLLTFLRRKESGDLMMYTKRERLMIDREIEDMQKKIGGIVGLRGKPAALFVVDARREKTSIREANKAGVPVVSLMDTNSDPTGVNHVIPGNDDAIRSVALIIKAISDAVEAGYAVYAESTKKVEPIVEPVVATAPIEAPLIVSADEAAHLAVGKDIHKLVGKVDGLVVEKANVVEDLGVPEKTDSKVVKAKAPKTSKAPKEASKSLKLSIKTDTKKGSKK